MLEYSRLINETNNAIEWIRNYVEKTNTKGVVIGNSGGKDSATVIAMATKALGKERVLTVAMPCNSIKEDLDDAKLVSSTFDVELKIIDLSNTYSELEKSIDLELSDESKINIKPRLRMTTLYAIAQNKGYLVMGTSNLCERMVGYTSKWGDSASDFNPIGNFTVDEVLEIGKYLGVPERIINKPPSDGLGKLTDEEKMGVSYKQIEEFIETGKTDPDAMEIIKKRNISSKHKRELVPLYEFERKIYLN